MNSPALLAIYCFGILVAFVLGGWVESFVRLTHTRVQVVLSLVAGLVIGVAMFHLLPHGFERITGDDPFEVIVSWMLAGIVLMVLLLRVFPLHEHDPSTEKSAVLDPDGKGDAPSLHWPGLTFGMGLHGLTEGAALGAAVLSREAVAAGVDSVSLGVFLAIMLHKPLDASFLLGMFRAAGLGARSRYAFGVAAALVCPLAAIATYWGVGQQAAEGEVIGRALAFGAGALICISLSDLLPELHFHRHDRLKLTISFLVGVALAYGLHVLKHVP